MQTVLYYWGERITELGIGPKPIRYKELTVERLQEAIRLSVGNHQTKQKAAGLGQKIRTENGVKKALRIFETMLSTKSQHKRA